MHAICIGKQISTAAMTQASFRQFTDMSLENNYVPSTDYFE